MTEPQYNIHRTAVIDADAIAYQIAAWAHSSQASTLELGEYVKSKFEEWKRVACATETIVCFSDSRENNFRREFYPLYKSNRVSTPPALLPKAQSMLKSMADKHLTVPTLEADDLLGILSANGKVENPVMVGIDKDLRQIPGWHVNPDKEDFPVLVSQDEADRLFYMQILTGDSTDGFGGIKGCGAVKARKILDAPDETGLDFESKAEEWESKVVAAYEAAGMTWEDLLGQARCARILRAEDWDTEAKAVIPWEPRFEMAEAG